MSTCPIWEENERREKKKIPGHKQMKLLYQQCISVPVFPHTRQRPTFSFFVILAILIGVKWYCRVRKPNININYVLLYVY